MNCQLSFASCNCNVKPTSDANSIINFLGRPLLVFLAVLISQPFPSHDVYYSILLATIRLYILFLLVCFDPKITYYIRIYRIGCLFFFGLGLFPFTRGRSPLFSTSIERGIVPGLYLIEHCLGLF